MTHNARKRANVSIAFIAKRYYAMPVCFGPCPEPDGFVAPECMVITDRSSVAAGGIASFHTSTLAVGLQVDDRLCGSQDLSIQILSLGSFQSRDTRSYDAELALRPPHSAVWTFLPTITRLRS